MGSWPMTAATSSSARDAPSTTEADSIPTGRSEQVGGCDRLVEIIADARRLPLNAQLAHSVPKPGGVAKSRSLTGLAAMSALDCPADPTTLGFDPARLQRIDSHFADYVDSGRLAGWQVAIMRDGTAGAPFDLRETKPRDRRRVGARHHRPDVFDVKADHFCGSDDPA